LRSFALLLPEFAKLVESLSDNGTLLFILLFDFLDRLAGSPSDKDVVCIKEIFSLLEVLLFNISDETADRFVFRWTLVNRTYNYSSDLHLFYPPA